MPFKFLENESKEFKNEYTKVYEGIKKENPLFTEEKVAKLSWYVVKRRYRKDAETEKWILKKDKVNASIDNFIDEILSYTNEYDLSFASKQDGHIDFPVTANIIDIDLVEGEDKKEQTERIFTKFKNSDLLPITLKMAHIDKPNGNLDNLLEADVQDALSTIPYKAIGWEHELYRPIGVLSDGSIKDDALEGKYLKVNGNIWIKRFPVESKEVIGRYLDGYLKNSLEVWYKYQECPICSGLYAAKDEPLCEHLENRFSTNTARNLKILNFCGTSIVKNPADSIADVISLGTFAQTEQVQLDELWQEVNNLSKIIEKLKNNNK